MFKKWGAEAEAVHTGGNGDKSGSGSSEAAAEVSARTVNKTAETVQQPASGPKSRNTILKGSKLIGDIHVTSDLELSGDVEGNIKSDSNSNIVLKGSCKGNIETKEGSVNIDGSLEGGNVVAGRDVTITGKFRGGEIKAKDRIYINGDFDGVLEGNEVEIGMNATGKGEIRYREYISIARGARVEAHISQSQKDLKLVKEAPRKNVVEIKSDSRAVKEESKEKTS